MTLTQNTQPLHDELSSEELLGAARQRLLLLRNPAVLLASLLARLVRVEDEEQREDDGGEVRDHGSDQREEGAVLARQVHPKVRGQLEGVDGRQAQGRGQEERRHAVEFEHLAGSQLDRHENRPAQEAQQGRKVGDQRRVQEPQLV